MSQLPSRRIGDQVVSALGLGCMGMSAVYGRPDAAEARATLDRAIDLAQKAGNTHALVTALRNKLSMLVSPSLSLSLPTVSETHLPPDLDNDHTNTNEQESTRTSSLCRICLDPYTEPTVSTGCWHTCCRECWLRCLGSTKLCPICKRITAAADLRRIYL